MSYNDNSLGRFLSPGLVDGFITRLTNSWRGEKPWAALRPLGALYGYGAWLRRRYYARFFRVEKADRPVVAIGNLTVGGSGKTPLCLALAKLLIARGHQPAVLSRGYGRRRLSDAPVVVSRGDGPVSALAESGDEPWLMASQLAGLRIVVDSRRARAAQLAVEELEADLLLLDDGFQHLGLAADCRVLLVPARNPFGNGAVLPAGPLREPLSAHKMAHILVSTGAERPAPEVTELAMGRPVFAAEYHPAGWTPLLEGGPVTPPESLAGKRVYAFCGLGRPDSFERSLKKLDLDVRRFVALRDHQRYGRDVLDALGLDFMASGAELLVTTAKDAVKIPAGAFPLPVMVLNMEMGLNHPAEFVGTVMNIAAGRNR
ncbi:tetraacyldisaccharide 4'-kinase [Deltaproteobacteria bacterium OttesenSCG-928-M10]|nr:tetraacyldisaccharide 4'-kinase [Deltaproteobacteria bacterium OttesenSCG-928-M10]